MMPSRLTRIFSSVLLVSSNAIINNNVLVFAWSSASGAFSLLKKNRRCIAAIRSGSPLWSTSTSNDRKSSDFNVVFRPSSKPDAFDSFKVGSPCIHRYNSNSGNSNGETEEEVEYWMWYHGRSIVEGEENVNLAPLSTGRIGLAFSRNGLHWERQSNNIGTLTEESMAGVTFGKNTDSWWGFDTAHVGLGEVLMPMSTPAIAGNPEGGVYLMYYMGGSNEEQPISEFIMSSSSTATVKGMRLKIGVALSQDGRTWGRVEGDDHTGAILIPHDKANVDKNSKELSSVLEEELYVGWPDVVVLNDIKQQKQQFVMYYSTALKDSKQKCIGYAVSHDGFRWEKRGICRRPSSSPLDVNGCARCHVSKRHIYRNGTWMEADGFIMLYEGIAEDGKHRILAATSNDGFTWEDSSALVLDVGEPGAWDEGGVGSPQILRMDDGTLRMYYVGQALDGSTAIGVAKGSMEGELFVREKVQFTFA